MTHSRHCIAWLLGLAILTLNPAFAGFQVPIEQESGASVEEIIDRAFDRGRWVGLSVALVRPTGELEIFTRGLADKEGEVPVTATTRFPIGSVTKPLTAMTVLRLRDDGLLRLDDPLADYLEAGGPRNPFGRTPVTVGHLLSHTGGMPRLPSNFSPVEGDLYNDYPVESLLEELASVELAWIPGTRYQYSNLGMAALGPVIEAATGKTYREAVGELFLAPLGMKSAGWEPDEDTALPYKSASDGSPVPRWRLGAIEPAGGLYASAQDMTGLLLWLAGHEDPEHVPIARDSLVQATSVHALAGSWNHAVGYGWVLDPVPGLGVMAWHNGQVSGSVAYLAWLPEFECGVAVMANTEHEVDRLARRLLEAVAHEAHNRPPALARHDIELMDRLAAAFRPNPPEDIVTRFHAGFLQEVPPVQLLGLFDQIGRMHGACSAWEVVGGGRGQALIFHLTFESGGLLKMTLATDGAEPPKVAMMLLEPVE